MRKFEDFNWAGNTTFIDTAKMSLEALLSANQKSWETVAQSTVTWKTALDITEFVNTDPLPDTEIGIIAQNVGDIYTLAYAQMVQAKSDEEVLSALETAKRTPKKRGWISCLSSEPKNGRRMSRKSTLRNKIIGGEIMAFALRSRFIAMLSFVLVSSIMGGSVPVMAEEESNPPFETEVIVRTVNQFKNTADVQNFIQLSTSYGVDVISMNVKQDEDDEVPSGSVFYQSDIAPIAQGYENFDALQAVITAAHAAGIKVHAWIPQFHDQQAFLANDEWQMQALVNGVQTPFTGSNGNEYFVNPIHHEVQQYERSIIQEVIENYAVDGVVLDWIRFDNYNMDVSDYTALKYQAQFGYSPLSIDFDTDSPQREQWNEWRTEQIGQYVGDIRQDITQSSKPYVKLGVYILPPEFTEVGQNVAKFKDDIDFVAPMAYFDDWEFNSDWVYSTSYGILKDTSDRISGSDVEIVATLDNDWTDDQYQEIYKGIRENYPDVKRLSFFAYGAWPEDELANIKERETWPTPGWTPPVEQDYPAQLPAGWKARNIGSMPGNVTYNSSNKQYTLSSSSTDIWEMEIN